jgi:hypothetical protein
MTPSPAHDLVRACLRWDQAGDRALRGLDASGWSALMAAVRERDGQPLLARRLFRIPDLDVPEDVVGELHRCKLDVATRSLAALARVGPAVLAAGVPVMALKGLDLATRVYGDMGSRPMGDIDLLVRPEHVAAMADALRAEGFRANARVRQAPHHLVFRSPLKGGLPVELHWALGPRIGQAERPDLLNALWEKPEEIEITGIRFLVPGRQHLLLFLCHHLEQHLFETPLTHIWDLGEVLDQAGDGFDWQRFWQECDRFRRRRGAQAAMFLAVNRLGIAAPLPTLPPDVQELLPDVVANLGRYPRTEAREQSAVYVLFFDPRTPWLVRWHLLRGILFPSRRLLAEGGGGASGPMAYLMVWKKVMASFFRKRVLGRLKAAPTRSRGIRTARLTLWLR